jgi:hypothetical protein
MSTQTTPERDLPWIPLLVGLIVGLALGLFTGWVVWPVEYTGATFMDMSQETRIDYVSAVADGYVIYNSPEAALEAGRRLAIMGDHAPDEILAAIDYYRTPPNENAVRVSNLAQLATALGIPVDAAVMAIATPPTYVAIGETPTAESATASATAESGAAPSDASQSSLLPWLAGLVAIALVVAGVVLLSRLGGKNRGAENASATTPASNPTPNTTASGGAPTQSDPGIRRAGSERVNPGQDDEFFDDGEGPAVQRGRPAEDDMIFVGDPVNALHSEEGPDDDEDLSDAYGQRPDGGSAAAMSTDRRTLSSFTARFQGSAATFRSDVKQINDPTTGANIGEYGLELNDRNRTLSSTPEQVVALTVYLLDKVQSRAAAMPRRVLLSELASDKGAEQVFAKENGENLRPFVAHPGIDFTLDANTLALKCHIQDVRYDQDGAFQEVIIEMAVLRRTG